MLKQSVKYNLKPYSQLMDKMSYLVMRVNTALLQNVEVFIMYNQLNLKTGDVYIYNFKRMFVG